ncbi:MAG: hypothetical protein IJY22_01495 [Clostridia bacterium]|nr:hypothetical protein [Clostridia bacterium]
MAELEGQGFVGGGGMNDKEKTKVILWNLGWFSLGANFAVAGTTVACARKEYSFLAVVWLIFFFAIIVGVLRVSAMIKLGKLSYSGIFTFHVLGLIFSAILAIAIYSDVSWGGVIAIGTMLVVETIVGIVLYFRCRIRNHLKIWWTRLKKRK